VDRCWWAAIINIFYFIINASITSILINEKDGVLRPQVVLFLTLVIICSYGYYKLEVAEKTNRENLVEYHKQKWVPFFEDLPFKKYLAPYFPNARNYVAGIEAASFPVREYQLAPLIYYQYREVLNAYAVLFICLSLIVVAVMNTKIAGLVKAGES
jgi:apolipoprotein N-acyltransferase